MRFHLLVITLIALLYPNTSYVNTRIKDSVAIVAGDMLNVRKSPSLKSDVIIQLKIGFIIKVLKKTNKYVTFNGKKGRWVYIDTQYYIYKNVKSNVYPDNKSLKGWVFDYYLGYMDNFRKITNWNHDKLYLYWIDWGYDYSFTKDGRFSLKRSVSDGNCSRTPKICNQWGSKYIDKCTCEYTGSLYRFKNIIWARIDTLKYEFHYFLYLKDNKLCMLLTNETEDSIYCE